MRVTLMICATAALGLSAGSAMAWGDMYMGDATNNPNSNFLMHAYPTKHNYCPEGLQPVTIGGEICCGVPNAGPYVNRAGKVHKVRKVMKSHAPKRRAHKPRAQVVEGVKGVVFR